MNVVFLRKGNFSIPGNPTRNESYHRGRMEGGDEWNDYELILISEAILTLERAAQGNPGRLARGGGHRFYYFGNV